MVLGWTCVAIALLTIVLIPLILFLARVYLHPFLAPNVPLDPAELLVVEGWMEDQDLKGALLEFQRGGYRRLITVGGPLAFGSFLSEYKTLAHLAAATLIALGGNPEAIVAVSSDAVAQNRTAAIAMNLQQWLAIHEPQVRTLNVYSHGVHARRSWISYQRHLDSRIQIGVISAPPLDYDPQHWWRSSTGFKRVVVECIGYGYLYLVNPTKHVVHQRSPAQAQNVTQAHTGLDQQSPSAALDDGVG